MKMSHECLLSDSLDNISFSVSTKAYNNCDIHNLVEKRSNVSREELAEIANQIVKEVEQITLDDSQFLDESFIAIDEPERDQETIPCEKTDPTTDKTEPDLNRSFVKSKSLSEWGLPDAILEKYNANKIFDMFDWQVECLSKKSVLEDGGNLVYSAPTSAGKTLVAEILAIKTVLERKKKVIFVLPFVSVVREKMFYFQDILSSSGIRVEGLMGSYNPPGGFSAVHVAICTIEKANSLINRLLEEKRLDELGAVIVDEIHLLGDPSRGYQLELLLTKLKYMAKRAEEGSNSNIQIIGMSATLPNLDLLANWLDAELFVTTYRPIPLFEQCHVNGEIYGPDMTCRRKLSKIPELDVDTDNILQLCLETIFESCSVLIFCPTKNWCENLSQQLAAAFWKLGKGDSEHGRRLREQLNGDALREVLEQLRNCPVGLDAHLQRVVSFGVCFHHAGLTMDERDIIEGAFKRNALRVLVATSTLSSGVNLPARRVIIRTPIFHGRAIDALTYRQMIGRAGRMGKDTSGESVLICQKTDYETVKHLMSAKLAPIQSCLQSGGSQRLKRAILEIICSEVATNPDDVSLFAKSTLLAAGATLTDNPVEETVAFLLENEFVRLQKMDDGSLKYFPTPLGKACLSSAMPPEEGLALFAELQRARRCFALDTELHIIYLVTPYSVCNQWPSIDWITYLDMWEKLPASMRRVGELVGVSDFYLVSQARGKAQAQSAQAFLKLQTHKRFYTALALQDLVSETPLNEVAHKYNCPRGLLQSLQQSAASFAGMVTAFSRQLGWATVEILVAQFQDRLQFGVSRELLDLMRLPILDGPKARALFNGGIQSLLSLASCDPHVLENVLYKSTPFESEKVGQNEAQKRKQMRSIWISGKQALTVREAADVLITHARKYMENELGFAAEIKWENVQNAALGPQGNCSVKIETQSTISNKESVSLTGSQHSNRSSHSLRATTSKNDSAKTNEKNLKNGSVTIQNEQQTYSVKIEAQRTNSNKENISLTESQDSNKTNNQNTDYSLRKAILTNENNSEKNSKNSFCANSRKHSTTQQNYSIKSETQRTNSNNINNKNADQSLTKSKDANNTNNKDTYNSPKPTVLTDRNETVKTIERNLKNCSITDSFSIKSGKHSTPKDKALTAPQESVAENSSSLFSEECDSSAKLEHNISSTSKEDSSKRLSFNDAMDSGFELNASSNDLFDSSDNLKKIQQDIDKVGLSFNNIDWGSDIDFDSQKLGAEGDNKENVKKHIVSSANVVRPLDVSKSPVRNSQGKRQRTSLTIEQDLSIRTPSKKARVVKVKNNVKFPSIITDSGIFTSSKDKKTESVVNANPPINFSNVEIIDVCANEELFATFAKEISAKRTFALSLACTKIKERKSTIGENMLKLNANTNKETKVAEKAFAYKEILLEGITFCWGENVAYYVPVKNEIVPWAKVSNLLEHVFSNVDNLIRIFDCKEQINLLKRCCDIGFKCCADDPKVGDWIIEPDENEKNFLAMLTTYAPEALSLAQIGGNYKGTGSIGLDTGSAIESRIRSSIEAILTFRLVDSIKAKLFRDERNISIFNLEMSSVLCLTQMELDGFSVNRKQLQDLDVLLKDLCQKLQKKAFQLAGRSFSFNSPREVSKIIGIWKSGRRVSTSKQVLEQNDHPISKLILQWRKTNSTLTRLIYPLLRIIEKDKLHGNCLTFTATGRISMHEPNLQNIPRDFEVFDPIENANVTVSCRSAFSTSNDNILVSADYCQLELRLLTHYCQDPVLYSIMKSDQDVFKLIAAKWNNVDVNEVDDKMRQNTKQICYGIIYGMGKKALAEQLSITEEEADNFVESFHSKYVSIRKFMQKTIENCCKNGYVETISGRKRYLSHINSEDNTLKKQAERQAVNTYIQGSAADIAKNAMVAINSNIQKSKFVAKLVLQLHDELIYEVPLKYKTEFAKILKNSMENSVELSIPFPVKLKSGSSWGALEEFFI